MGGYTNAVHEMGIAIEVYRTCREAVEANGESVRSLFSAQDETAVDQSAEAESVVEPVQEKEAPKAKASKKAA